MIPGVLAWAMIVEVLATGTAPCQAYHDDTAVLLRLGHFWAENQPCAVVLTCRSSSPPEGSRADHQSGWQRAPCGCSPCRVATAVHRCRCSLRKQPSQQQVCTAANFLEGKSMQIDCAGWLSRPAAIQGQFPNLNCGSAMQQCWW